MVTSIINALSMLSKKSLLTEDELISKYDKMVSILGEMILNGNIEHTNRNIILNLISGNTSKIADEWLSIPELSSHSIVGENLQIQDNSPFIFEEGSDEEEDK